MAALTLPSLKFVLGAMAPGLVLTPAAPPRAFRSNKAVAPCGFSSANSIPCFPSALVHGAYSYKRAQSSLYSVCSLLSRFPTIPSPFVSPCCSSSANTIPCFPSALVPGAYSYKHAQSSLYSVCSLLSRFPAIPSPFVNPALHNMPRERPRMGCRRGGSRGRASHQHSSTTSDPSSDASEFCCYRYPATRSGRGRGRRQVRAEVCTHHSHPHTAHFRIPCSLGNSSFIVSVTVEMCENVVGSGEVHHGAPMEHRMADQNVSQHQDTGGLPIMNTDANAGPSAPAGGDPSSSAAHPSDSKDSDQFGCRIVEEQPSTSDED